MVEGVELNPGEIKRSTTFDCRAFVSGTTPLAREYLVNYPGRTVPGSRIVTAAAGCPIGRPAGPKNHWAARIRGLWLASKADPYRVPFRLHYVHDSTRPVTHLSHEEVK